jgi:hypothetical protein
MPITDIVTPDYLRTNLLGSIIPLVARTGQAISDDALWAAIDEAVSQLEAEFGLALTTTRFRDEGLRMRITQFTDETYNLMLALKRPVQSIERLTVNIGNQEWYDLPTEWVYITSAAQGSLQIIPTSQGVATYRTSASAMMRTWFVRGPYVPGFYNITYRAGFEYLLPGTHVLEAGSDQVTVTGLGDVSLHQVLHSREWVSLGGSLMRVKSVTDAGYTVTNVSQVDHDGEAVALRYDADILSFIAYTALIPILATLGATLYGPGILGTSLRLDGLAQAKSMNPRGPFAAIIEQYTARAAQAKQAIYAKYAPMNIALIG